MSDESPNHVLKGKIARGLGIRFRVYGLGIEGFGFRIQGLGFKGCS